MAVSVNQDHPKLVSEVVPLVEAAQSRLADIFHRYGVFSHPAVMFALVAEMNRCFEKDPTGGGFAYLLDDIEARCKPLKW